MTPEASTAPHVPNFGLSQQQQPNVTRPPARPNSLTRIAATMAGHKQSHEPAFFSAAVMGAGAGTEVCDSDGVFGSAWPCTPGQENSAASSSAVPPSMLEFLQIRRDSECKHFSSPLIFKISPLRISLPIESILVILVIILLFFFNCGRLFAVCWPFVGRLLSVQDW